MKKRTLGIITYAVIIATTIICATSCTSTVTKHNIATADSIVNVNPQAALAFIDSVTESGDLSRASKMKFALLKAKARNKLYLPADTAMLETLAKYYDNHSTANDRMLTHYIIGCSHIDRDDAPRALQSFQDAIEMADTTDTECDYGTLSRIYSQMSNILNDEMSFAYAIEAGKKSIRYALAAKDTFNAISGYGHLMDSYYFTQPDSIMNICLKVSSMYKHIGKSKYAASVYGIPIFLMIKNGDTKKAKPYMDLYETYSGLYDKVTNSMEAGHEIYYYVKGMYYVLTHNLDSAEYFARKELNTTSDFDNRQGAAKCLYMIYKKKRQTDSIIKYAEMWNAATDSAYANMSTTHLQQMRAMYDYNNYKLSAEVYKRKALSARLVSAIVILTVSVMLVSVAIYMSKKRQARRIEMSRYESSIAELERARQELCAMNEQQQMEMSRLIDKKSNEIKKQKEANDTYLHNIQELERSRDELRDLNERQKAQFKSLIEEKETQIKQLYEEKKKHENAVTSVGNKSKYANEPIVKRLKHNARKGLTHMTNEEFDELRTLLSDTEQFNKIENIVSPHEFGVCLLVRAGFTPSDISILTGLSNSNISNIRKRLLMKLTGRNGSPKDFDKYITSL